MTEEQGEHSHVAVQEVQPVDVLVGLGSANREFLSASLALFEDTTLGRRFGQAGGAIADKAMGMFGTKPDSDSLKNTVRRVASSRDLWKLSKFSDDQLRVFLWIYLRESFALSPRLCVSRSAALHLCDDLVAAALATTASTKLDKIRDKFSSERNAPDPECLDELAREVFSELIKEALGDGSGMDLAAREELIERVREQLESMDKTSLESIMQAIGSNELNDAAIRKILMTTGSLTVFSAGVSMTGFSAYILAAQISAFIPMVSGPALVSLVSVVSNPVTVIAAAAGAGYMISKSSRQRIQAQVGVRILSLLALQGLNAGREHMRQTLHAFSSILSMRPYGDLDEDVLAKYKNEWRLIEPSLAVRPRIASTVLARMEKRYGYGNEESNSSESGGIFGASREELRYALVFAGLTVGDIVYNAAAIDPMVMQAADFARLDDLSGTLGFAEFAQEVADMSPSAQLGAISDIKGYVAERIVAAQLVSQGYQVDFPALSNQEGWDILVDGMPFQIKDVADLHHLAQHFDRFDYPVIANAEVANYLSERSVDALPDWESHVYFVEGYNNELVQHVTEQSIEAGNAMSHPHLPLFALGISVYRNLSSVSRGEISGAQAVQQVAFYGSTRVGLAVLGGFAGKAVGYLVFGPAGALVLGGATPAISQMQTGRVQAFADSYLRSDGYRTWAAGMEGALLKLYGTLDNTIDDKIDVLRGRLERVPEGDVGDYLRWRIEDDIQFLLESKCRLGEIRSRKCTEEVRFGATQEWLATSTVHPHKYQTELKAAAEHYRKRPLAVDQLKEHVTDAVEATATFVQGSATWVKKLWHGNKKPPPESDG